MRFCVGLGAPDGNRSQRQDNPSAKARGVPPGIASNWLHDHAADDKIGRDYDEAGFINVDCLAANTPTAVATYYLCGPRPFLRAYVSGLARCGVPLHRIRYEYFGPADELLAAA